MAALSLKKGSSANLNTVAKADGQLLVTTDKKKIYLDNGTTRLPLGDSSYAHYDHQYASESANNKYFKIDICHDINYTAWMMAFTVRLY